MATADTYETLIDVVLAAPQQIAADATADAQRGIPMTATSTRKHAVAWCADQAQLWRDARNGTPVKVDATHGSHPAVRPDSQVLVCNDTTSGEVVIVARIRVPA